MREAVVLLGLFLIGTVIGFFAERWYEFWDAAEAWVVSPPVDLSLTWFYGVCGLVVVLVLVKNWWNEWLG